MEIQYFTYLLNILVMLLLPFALAVFLVRRFHSDWDLVGVGATTFILSQFGHIPFNLVAETLFKQGILPPPPVDGRLWFNAIFLGLSAGIWEELARYTAYRWWAKDARSWRAGLLYGAGHGGVEAVIIGLLSLLSFFQLAALRATDLTQVVPASQVALLQQQVTQFWSAPLHLTILGAVERILAIILHLSLSVLVMQAVVNKRMRWLIFAVLWHALANALALVSLAHFGPLGAEVLLSFLALASLGVIFTLRRSLPEPQPLLQQTPAAAPNLLFQQNSTTELKPEDLDQTRFSNES